MVNASAILKGFTHRLLLFFIVLMFVIWALAIAIYFRSKYRSDLFTIIAPGRHCLTLTWDDGDISLEDQSPWPGPRLVAWASAPAHYNKSSDAEKAELRGPRLELTEAPFTSTSKEWGGFGFGHGIFGSAYRRNDPSMVAHEWRILPYDPEADSKVDLHDHWISAPTNLLAIALGIIPCLWLTIASARRWRRRSRRRKGLCIRCGYDLRGTRERCPECGLHVGNPPKISTQWHTALASLIIVLLVPTLALGLLSANIGAAVPAASSRIPSADVGLYVPWSFDLTHAEPAGCASCDNGDYSVQVSQPDGSFSQITILRGTKPIYSWSDFLPFRIKQDVLYRIDPSPNSLVGVSISATDLITGKEIWNSVMNNGAAAKGSLYFYSEENRTSISLDIQADKLFIWDDDPTGRSLEIKDLRSGNTIGHCFYERAEVTPPKITVAGFDEYVVEGKPWTLWLTAEYPQGTKGVIERWTVDWGDGKGNGSDVATYAYPAGADRKLSLQVTHLLNPGIAGVNLKVSGFDVGKGKMFTSETYEIGITPAPPSAVSHAPKSSTEIDLKWTNSALSRGTEIDVSTDFADPAAPGYVDTVPPGVDHYTAANLKPDTRYWFHLRTINDDAPGGSTEVATFSEKTKPADK